MAPWNGGHTIGPLDVVSPGCVTAYRVIRTGEIDSLVLVIQDGYDNKQFFPPKVSDSFALVDCRVQR